MQIFTKPNFNFIRWRWHAIALSLVVVLAGVGYMWSIGGMPMGIDFKGFSIQTYDREMKRWQMTWTDNMSARISLYTGQHAGDSTVLEGEDTMGGQTWLSRITSFNEKPTSFDWRMESSEDGGKSWMVVATATYTKRK